MNYILNSKTKRYQNSKKSRKKIIRNNKRCQNDSKTTNKLTLKNIDKQVNNVTYFNKMSPFNKKLFDYWLR